MGGERSELCQAGEMRRVPELLSKNARELRNASTKAERLLWLRLRRYRPRFTRQLVIKPFIVDLACREAKMAIELDGGQHAEATASYDRQRTAFLEQQGWAVLRLWNNDAEENPDGAAEFVLDYCARRLGSTHPQPMRPRQDRLGDGPRGSSSREGRKRRPRSRKLSPP